MKIKPINVQTTINFPTTDGILFKAFPHQAPPGAAAHIAEIQAKKAEEEAKKEAEKTNQISSKGHVCDIPLLHRLDILA